MTAFAFSLLLAAIFALPFVLASVFGPLDDHGISHRTLERKRRAIRADLRRSLGRRP